MRVLCDTMRATLRARRDAVIAAEHAAEDQVAAEGGDTAPEAEAAESEDTAAEVTVAAEGEVTTAAEG